LISSKIHDIFYRSIGDITYGGALTEMMISSIIPRVGRKRINEEQTPARFPAGTLARIDAVLDPETNEKRSDMIREAVERELKRRERKSEPSTVVELGLKAKR
jgi:hypothetical protein